MILHTKFQVNWPSSSGVEHILRILPYLGMTAILVMRSEPSVYTLFSRVPAYEIKLKLAQKYQRRSLFKMLTEGRQVIIGQGHLFGLDI